MASQPCIVSAMAAQTIPPSSPPGSPSIASLISAIISPNGDPNADVATTSTPASFTAVQLTGGSDTPGATNNLDFDFDDGNALWVYWNGNGNNAIRVGEAGALTDGNWHHIAVVYDSPTTTYTLYIDGNQFDQKVVNPVVFQDASALVIGNFEQAANIQGSSADNTWQSSFPGIIDQVRLIGQALSAADVMTLFNSKQ